MPTVVSHGTCFHAAVLLASDVSVYPTAVDAAMRQEEVWAAYRLLNESISHVKGIPLVLQTLRVTLQGRRSRPAMPLARDVSSRPEARETGLSPAGGGGGRNELKSAVG